MKDITKIQDFIWLAEYLDGSYIAEFTQRGTKNDFYSIKKKFLNKFSLIGHGNKLGFDIDSGTITLNGNILNLQYVNDGVTYELTGTRRYGDYEDIITYKDAYADSIKMNGNFTSSFITQYNLGFKKKFTFEDGTNINLQVLIKIPHDNIPHIETRIVSDKDMMNGKLLINRVGSISEELKAPLKSGYAGICKYVIK